MLEPALPVPWIKAVEAPGGRGLSYPRGGTLHHYVSAGMTLHHSPRRVGRLFPSFRREKSGKARRVEPPPGFEPRTPGSLGTRGHPPGALTRPVLCPLSYGGMPQE